MGPSGAAHYLLTVSFCPSATARQLLPAVFQGRQRRGAWGRGRLWQKLFVARKARGTGCLQNKDGAARPIVAPDRHHFREPPAERCHRRWRILELSTLGDESRSPAPADRSAGNTEGIFGLCQRSSWEILVGEQACSQHQSRRPRNRGRC